METGETDHYTDGSRAEVTYDTTGQSFESSANWFDPAGRLYLQDTFYDNGRVAETGYNVSGVGDWTHYVASYDAASKRNPVRQPVPFLQEAVPKIMLDALRRPFETYDPAKIAASKRHNLSSRMLT